MRGTLEQRFRAKFQEGSNDECWIWRVAKNQKGYGVLFNEGSHLQAHRLSYEFHNGGIPVGNVICHRCDNPSCVNPHHLFAGTRADNNHDRDFKGRQVSRHSDDHYRVILTSSEVLEIRDKYKPRYGAIRRLAKEYGVKPSYISDVVHKRCWRHI